jgi:hypothetical protein
MDDDAILSADKRDEHGRFIIPPKSPGRPKGARNKLGEAFLADLLANWEKHGVETIEAVRAEKPDQYLKVVASILPRELNLKVSELDELSDEQLQRQLTHIVAQLAATGLDLVSGIGASEAPQPAGEIPTIQ